MCPSPGKLSAAATEAGTCKPQNQPGRRDPRSIPCQPRRAPRAHCPNCRRAHWSCLRKGAQQGPPGLLAARRTEWHLQNTDLSVSLPNDNLS
ncbi:hypothetical protein MC885_013372, partial [Smutsia gigantea]